MGSSLTQPEEVQYWSVYASCLKVVTIRPTSRETSVVFAFCVRLVGGNSYLYVRCNENVGRLSSAGITLWNHGTVGICY